MEVEEWQIMGKAWEHLYVTWTQGGCGRGGGGKGEFLTGIRDLVNV